MEDCPVYVYDPLQEHSNPIVFVLVAKVGEFIEFHQRIDWHKSLVSATLSEKCYRKRKSKHRENDLQQGSELDGGYFGESACNKPTRSKSVKFVSESFSLALVYVFSKSNEQFLTASWMRFEIAFVLFWTLSLLFNLLWVQFVLCPAPLRLTLGRRLSICSWLRRRWMWEVSSSRFSRSAMTYYLLSCSCIVCMGRARDWRLAAALSRNAWMRFTPRSRVSVRRQRWYPTTHR